MPANTNETEHDPIKGRMVKAFIKCSIISAIAAVVVVVALVITSRLYSHALEFYGFAQGDLGYALEDFAETRSATRAIIGYDDPEIAASAMEVHDEKKAEFEDSMTEVAAKVVNAETYAELTNLKTVAEEYWELEAEIIELGKEDDIEASKEAQQMAEDQLDPMYEEISGYLVNMMNMKISDGNAMDLKLNILTWVMVALSVILIIIAMASSIHKGKTVAHRIAGSLNELGERLEAFAEGDLTSEFPEFEVKDEINDMAENAADMAANLKVLIEDVDYLIKEVANGDFTVVTKCPERYVGEFAPLRESVIHLKNKMTETMRQIEAASDQVDCGSRQLAESATSLAEGSMEQAGSVEQMTATIVNVSNQSEASAKQIEEAYQKGLVYREKAEKGKEDIAQLVDAMEAISKVSIEIRNIIGDIENIAAQTNLLSLNASIEAARAGEAGKGFAVVASQIGTLASDSAQSAVRTRELIENSLEEIERGNAMMDQTNEVLQDVVEGIVFLSNASKDASEISYNNVRTMQELEEGIEEISGVVQNNSSSAEETSSTSEELAAQATTLKELVGQFKMNEI